MMNERDLTIHQHHTLAAELRQTQFRLECLLAFLVTRRVRIRTLKAATTAAGKVQQLVLALQSELGEVGFTIYGPGSDS